MFGMMFPIIIGVVGYILSAIGKSMENNVLNVVGMIFTFIGGLWLLCISAYNFGYMLG